MSGKSNFIEFFRFLNRVAFPQPGVWGLANAFTGGFSEYTWKGGSSSLIVISLEGGAIGEADLPFDGWRYEIAMVGDEFGSVRVQQEELAVSSAGRFDDLIANKEGHRTLINRDGREAYPGVDANRAAIEFEIPAWEGSFLRRLIARCYFYDLIPQHMKIANPAGAPRFLTQDGANLAAWLNQLQTRYSDAFAKINQVCRDVLPGFTELFTWPTQQATVFVGSRERHLKHPVPMWQMSDGELAFVALLALIFSPPELGATLYCVEEPENHLHPKMIETLMELLTQVQDDLGAQGSAQVIATTHSPQLVDRVSLDQLIVFEKREGCTAVSYPSDKAHLRRLLENEEMGLGDLFYSGALQSD